jgi:hypothetical protein
MVTADLLSYFETCQLKGHWASSYQRRKLDPTDMLREGIKAGLISDTKTPGEDAGTRIMELAENPGMETQQSDIYRSVFHHACLADLITDAIGAPGRRRWTLPPTGSLNGAPWSSGAFLDPSGEKLRRLVLASSWSDARHFSEVRSWYTLGEMAVYDLPMTMVVLILGPFRDGRRSGAWTKGFRHPFSHQLRFRKKSKTSSETFSDKWEKVWREDRDEISNQQWLQAMLGDDILRDVCFTVEVPALLAPARDRILEMASRKLERLATIEKDPEPSLSVCERPPCQFRGCCHSEKPYHPSKSQLFVRIREGDKQCLPACQPLPKI